MTQFNYFDSNLLPFTFPMEYDEILSQSHYIEYDWLIPDLTWNTWGRYIPVFPVVLMTLTSLPLFLDVLSPLPQLNLCIMLTISFPDQRVPNFCWVTIIFFHIVIYLTSCTSNLNFLLLGIAQPHGWYFFCLEPCLCLDKNLLGPLQIYCLCRVNRLMGYWINVVCYYGVIVQLKIWS